MKALPITHLRTKLTIWYVGVLAVLLIVYAATVFAFQYVVLTRQIVHDEVQDVETVEGLLFFDAQNTLQLRQDYYSRPQSHLLIDRLMEVRDLSGHVLYRSPTLMGMSLGGPNRAGEGEADFDERLIRLQDGSHVLLISHIHDMRGSPLLIRLGYSLAPLRARMIEFLLLLLVAIPIALALAAIAGHTIAKRGLRPLEQMASRAEGITASNLHDRLEVPDPQDELGQMATVFNRLLDRLEQAFAQLHRFTADASHELRTPLASLRAIGEVALQRGPDPQGQQEALSCILEESEHLSETIDSLLLLARAEALQPGERATVFSVEQLLEEVLSVLDVVLEEGNIRIVRQGEQMGEMNVRADRNLLRTAILNVVHNALKFSPSCSALTIGCTRSEANPSELQLSIEDEGPGIAEGESDLVFERFFTSSSRTTAHKSGTGLGLPIAKLVIERLGGTIKFEKPILRGARCVITLPVFE